MKIIKGVCVQSETIVFPATITQIRLEKNDFEKNLTYCRDHDLPLIVKCKHVTRIHESDSDSDSSSDILNKNIATVVKITNFQILEDGKVELRLLGKGRVSIIQLENDEDIEIASSVIVEDEDIHNPERAYALCMRAKESFSQLVEKAFKEIEVDVNVVFPSEPYELSFAISHFLPLDEKEKLLLVSMDDTCERLAVLIPLIEEYLSMSPDNHANKITSKHLKDWISPN